MRLRAGLTQTDLAARTGLSAGAIRNGEQGRRVPGLDLAARVAAALDISLDQLVGDLGDRMLTEHRAFPGDDI
jgi:transcriptional regulator with XRE-family HTH domain